MSPVLSAAVQAFFGSRMGELGQYLSKARWQVERGRKATADELAVDGLTVRPRSRWLDEKSGTAADVIGLWDLDSVPEGAVVTIAGTRVPVQDVPTEVAPFAIPDAEGDHRVPVKVMLGDATLRTEDILISRTRNRLARFEAIETAVKAIPRKPRSSLVESMRWNLQLLRTVNRGRSVETEIPAHRLLTRVESMITAAGSGKRWFGPERPGDHFVRLATEGGLVTARLMVPEKLAEKPALVIALHGAGGSENLFFDGYGDGLGPELAAKRGWLFLAPQTSTRPSAIVGAVDELERMFGAIDRSRVFLMGHSMGAAATAGIHQTYPKAFARLALLGGGGTIRDPDLFADTPTFIGVGDQDFLMRGASGFAKRLRRAGIESAVYKEYADVEHMAIVQLALPDVFAFFGN